MAEDASLEHAEDEASRPAEQAPEGGTDSAPLSRESVNRSVTVPYTDPSGAEARSDRMGRYSMYLAIAVFVLSAGASILIGLYGTTVYHYHQTVITNGHSSASSGFNERPNQLAFVTQGALGTIFGITAIVMGIVAAAKKRGRRFGVIAIVVAALAPVISVILFAVIGLAVGQNVSQ